MGKDTNDKSKRVRSAYDNQADIISQNTADIIERNNKATEDYLAAKQSADKGLDNAVQSARDVYRQRMDEGYQQLDDILGGYKQDEAKAQAEADSEYANAQKHSRLAGLTAGLASLINLVGVTKGASNQQINTNLPMDWMKIADANRKQNRARIDNIRERQRALQQQLAILKQKDAGVALKDALSDAERAYNNQVADAKVVLANQQDNNKARAVAADKAGALRTEGEIAGIKTEMQEEARADAKAENAANRNMRYDLYGWTVDEKTGKRVPPAVNVLSSSRSGKGGSETVLSIAPADGKGKGVTIRIGNNSLLSTINANLDLVTSEDDRKGIRRILNGDGSADDKAKELQQYIKTSPDLLRVIQRSATAVSEFDWSEDEAKPATKDDKTTTASEDNNSVYGVSDLDKILGMGN